MKSHHQELTLMQIAEQQKEAAKKFERLLKSALKKAKDSGADHAEIWCGHSAGNSIEVRNQEVETLEFNQDSHLSITVYKNQSKGSVSVNDVTELGIQKGIEAALSIAKVTEPDPYSGLADKDRLVKELRDLDLLHPSNHSIRDSVEQAKAADARALENKAVKQSEGTTVSSHCSLSLYANSYDFLVQNSGSRYSLSSGVLGESSAGMQRDSYYSVARDFKDLLSPEQVGSEAATRLSKRLNIGKAKNGQFSVLFSPEMARSIWGHLLGALRGRALYQKASFLLDKKDTKIVPDFISLREDPFIKKGFASKNYDAEGVATYPRDIVRSGVLKDYFLGSYSARRLGLESTASSGGMQNILIDGATESFENLVASVGTGLLVTELMGQGVNLVTGNYSRGASGFWIENGEVQKFVQEVTIASNLTDMLKNIRALGQDLDLRSGILCGSMIVDGMTVATN